MKTELRQEERVLKEGRANLQKGIETVGGHLFLTNQRLIFEAHIFNVQGGLTEMDLSTVRAARPCWTNVLGFIPLIPNSLAVSDERGETLRFVLFGRHAWAKAIEAQRHSVSLDD